MPTAGVAPWSMDRPSLLRQRRAPPRKVARPLLHEMRIGQACQVLDEEEVCQVAPARC